MLNFCYCIIGNPLIPMCGTIIPNFEFHTEHFDSASLSCSLLIAYSWMYTHWLSQVTLVTHAHIALLPSLLLKYVPLSAYLNNIASPQSIPLLCDVQLESYIILKELELYPGSYVTTTATTDFSPACFLYFFVGHHFFMLTTLPATIKDLAFNWLPPCIWENAISCFSDNTSIVKDLRWAFSHHHTQKINPLWK